MNIKLSFFFFLNFLYILYCFITAEWCEKNTTTKHASSLCGFWFVKTDQVKHLRCIIPTLRTYTELCNVVQNIHVHYNYYFWRKAFLFKKNFFKDFHYSIRRSKIGRCIVIFTLGVKKKKRKTLKLDYCSEFRL